VITSKTQQVVLGLDLHIFSSIVSS